MKLPEPWTFFVDRSLGRDVVASALRRAGLSVETHDTHFPKDTQDHVWLRDVGGRGWVVLTKDKDIRRNALELLAVVEGGVACFQLGRGDLGGPAMASGFLTGMPRIHRALRRFDVPLVASVALSGAVRVLFAGGAWLSPPRDLK